jgi:DNA-binding NtrC family response regulator
MERLQVLILDDEPIVCKRLKPGLERSGYEVETFTDSREALRRIQEKTFDIVITDLKMDAIDGMEFLQKVKERSPRTEVIVITGFATMDTARETYSRGVFDFIAKPFKPSEIQEAVQKAEAKIRSGG